LSNETFRIGGLVEEGTLLRGQGETIRFSVTDGGASVPVTFTGILPDLFAENQGMIGLGNYVNGVFEATEILAKHDESYMPKEVVEALKAQGVYKEPNG
jgi:cytochrome c-type biogenesis protein CcmE